ncbi:MAG: hypothetical protein AUI09_01735 [Gemmatimonadetes bacterium 13_2_20CM_2_66_5]|nr:MAG: hypothetical protein AUI09_01735 [Gemmatimonadetes bacterium 13_2_20CM_2_66_5]
MLAATRGQRVDFMSLINAMSSTKLPNYAFRNNGDLTFTDVGAAWGIDRPSFSNGAAFGDLDGDGAPDLVVNNVNDEAFIYRNNARTQLPQNHFLQVRLGGDSLNPFAVGARVTARGGGRQFMQELEPTRGFQSSVDYTLTFGVGRVDTLDSVTVDWPDRRTSVLSHVATNQRLTIREQDRQVRPTVQPSNRPTLFKDVTAQVGLDFVHHENDFVDFDREPLIPKLVSTEGPFITVGDVNGDGLDDFFIGGAKGQPGALFIQQRDGRFVRSNPGLFEQDSISEDLGAVFFDADGDGHPDLYVVSGGSEYSALAPALQDRLYLNDGRGGGHFHKATGSLPAEDNSGSRVVAADYDGDGDIDLFVGGRVVPWRYGADPRSMLLQNDGHGHFTDVTRRLAPDLEHVGMVTDAWRAISPVTAVWTSSSATWVSTPVFTRATASRSRCTRRTSTAPARSSRSFPSTTRARATRSPCGTSCSARYRPSRRAIPVTKTMRTRRCATSSRPSSSKARSSNRPARSRPRSCATTATGRSPWSRCRTKRSSRPFTASWLAISIVTPRPTCCLPEISRVYSRRSAR